MNRVRKIVSGGQTGADRAALDFAIESGFECGGFVPFGRRTEDGPLDRRFPNMIETASAEYTERTELNVAESHATLIVSHGKLTGGSALTLDVARRTGRPALHIDLDATAAESAAAEVRRWLAANDCTTLNVAGPRASEDETIHSSVKDLLQRIFEFK